MKCKNCGKEHTPARTSVGVYCGNKCQHEFQKKQRISDWLSGGKLPGRGALIEYLSESLGGYKCSLCGISNWNNLPISLEIDHINGNPHDDSHKNLRLICPNCHSQTPTFKGKNKGNGRIHLRERRQQDYHRQKMPDKHCGDAVV